MHRGPRLGSPRRPRRSPWPWATSRCPRPRPRARPSAPVASTVRPPPKRNPFTTTSSARSPSPSRNATRGSAVLAAARASSGRHLARPEFDAREDPVRRHSTRATGPSTTATPRARNALRAVSSSRSGSVTKAVTRSLRARNICTWCAPFGVVTRRRCVGRGSPTRGRTGSGRPRVPPLSASPGRPQDVDGAGGDDQPAGGDDPAGVERDREADRVGVGARGGGRGHDPPGRHLGPVRGDLVAARSASARSARRPRARGRLWARGRRVPWFARCRRRARSGASAQDERGGQAGGRAADDDDVEVLSHGRSLRDPFRISKDACRSGNMATMVHSRENGSPRRRRRRWSTRSAHACGRCASAARSPSRRSPTRPGSRCRRSRGSSRASGGRPSSSCCRSPAPTRCRSTTWSGRRRRGTRGCTSGPSAHGGRVVIPL